MSITRLVMDSIAPWTESSKPLHIRVTLDSKTKIQDPVLRTQLIAVDHIAQGYLCESLDELDAIYTVGVRTYR